MEKGVEKGGILCVFPLFPSAFPAGKAYCQPQTIYLEFPCSFNGRTRHGISAMRLRSGVARAASQSHRSKLAPLWAAYSVPELRHSLSASNCTTNRRKSQSRRENSPSALSTGHHNTNLPVNPVGFRIMRIMLTKCHLSTKMLCRNPGFFAYFCRMVYIIIFT